MKIIFLHGLESNNLGKKEIFEKLGFKVTEDLSLNLDNTIYCPKIDYKYNHVFEKTMEMIFNLKPDYIVGSSIGGFLGFHIGQLLNIKNIIFNPAIPYRSVDVKFKQVVNFNFNLSQFIFGKNDNLINYKDTLAFFNNSIELKSEVFDFEHRIPDDIMESVLNKYLK